jgi:hypothetical protein
VDAPEGPLDPILGNDFVRHWRSEIDRSADRVTSVAFAPPIQVQARKMTVFSRTSDPTMEGNSVPGAGHRASGQGYRVVLFGKDCLTVLNPDVGQRGCGSIAAIYTLMPSDAMNRVDKNTNSNSKGSAKKQHPIRKQRLIATMVQIPIHPPLLTPKGFSFLTFRGSGSTGYQAPSGVNRRMKPVRSEFWDRELGEQTVLRSGLGHLRVVKPETIVDQLIAPVLRSLLTRLIWRRLHWQTKATQCRSRAARFGAR